MKVRLVPCRFRKSSGEEERRIIQMHPNYGYPAVLSQQFIEMEHEGQRFSLRWFVARYPLGGEMLYDEVSWNEATRIMEERRASAE